MRDKLFNEVLSNLEVGLSCDLVSSELDFEKGVFHLEDNSEDILNYARENRYERIALYDRYDDKSIGGKIVTHVAEIDDNYRKILRRRVIGPEDIITDSTPLDKVISLLRLREFYFVMKMNLIQKIVTVADINRLAVRVYIFSMISRLETLMSKIIGNKFKDDCWMDLLTKERKEKIYKVEEERKEGRFDVSLELLDCANFNDKIVVIRKSDIIK